MKRIPFLVYILRLTQSSWVDSHNGAKLSLSLCFLFTIFELEAHYRLNQQTLVKRIPFHSNIAVNYKMDYNSVNKHYLKIDIFIQFLDINIHH